MNTPTEIKPIDLLRLALSEFKHYDRLAEGGDFEMFASARLARELVRETVEIAEDDKWCGAEKIERRCEATRFTTDDAPCKLPKGHSGSHDYNP